MERNLHAAAILEELQGAVSQLDDEQAGVLAERIMQTRKVFLAGAGRSGLMIKAFAMRLMHLGIEAYVVGESITPNVTEHDLFIIGSGSGETRSLLSMGEKARSLQASVAAVTIFPESSIGRLADTVIKLVGSPKDQLNEGFTRQPMGSLFEQTLLVFFDSVILRLMEQKGYDSAAMYGRHANLE